jgi:dTDP-4-amino-4,6-dideoxygalactose transaminase
VGWNDRLPNLNAALGFAQLENLDRRLHAKRHLAQRYAEVFADLEGVELVAEPADCRSNHWLVSLRFTADDPLIAQTSRLQLLERAHSIGLLLRPIWTPLHQLPIFEASPSGSLAVAENEAVRLVNLPSSPQLLQGWAS